MSTNSPEEAHEETEIRSPAHMEEPSTEKDLGGATNEGYLGRGRIERRGDRRVSGERNHSLPD